MTREEELIKVSIEYRKSREECGVKDPILLDEVEEAYYLGAIWADQNPIHNKNVDLEKEIQAFAKMDLYPIEISDSNLSIIVTKHQIYKCARHFFNLGLKSQKGE